MHSITVGIPDMPRVFSFFDVFSSISSNSHLEDLSEIDCNLWPLTELCLPSAPIDSIQLRIIATDNVSSNLSMSSNESIEARTPCPNVASNGGSHGHQYDICSDMDVHNGEHSKEDSSAECTDESEIVNSTQEMYPLSCYTSQDSYVPNNDLSENPYVNKEKAYFSPCDDDDASDSRSRCGSSTFRNELEGSHTTVFDFPSCETEQDHNQEDSSNDSTRY